MFAAAQITHHFARQEAAFFLVDLPTHHLATEYVQEQVQMALGQPLEIHTSDRKRHLSTILDAEN